MRRVLLTIEREVAIEIEEDRLERVLRNLDKLPEPPAHRLEGLLSKEALAGIDRLANLIGTDADEQDFAIETELQEKCEKHDLWYPLAPKRLAGCWKCINERRNKK